MTPRELIAAFEVLADAPDGVARLRELVLRLAVDGCLVPRSEPAPLRRLADVVEGFQNGTSSRGGEGGPAVVVLRLADIKRGRINALSTRSIDLSTESAAKYKVVPGDVLAIRVNGSADLVGRFIPVEADEGWCYCDHLIRVRPRANILDYRYLCLVGGSTMAREHLAGVTMTTAGQKTVNQKGLGALAIQVPPLAEQHRIVARVDDLMALLDRLEAARTAREEARRAARDSALAALRDAEDADEVEAAWARIVTAGDFLIESRDDVERLRSVILALAVRGKVVPQRADDEPAEALLAARRVPVPAPPFDLPPGWAWTDLGHLGTVRGGGTPSKANARLWDGSIPWVSPKDMKVSEIGDAQDHVSPDALTESAVKLIPTGSLLMVVRGMILAHSFPVAVTKVKVTINQDMKAVTPFRADILPFLLLVLQGSCDRVLDLVERSTHGTCRLAWEKVASVPLAIPPLAEQHRIVAKVDELMSLCDALEAKLTAARDLHEQLAAAAVHHLDV